MTSCLRAAWVGAALTAALAGQEPVVVSGRYFEVCCHGGSDRVAMQALAAVEPVWPEVCAFLGAPSTPPAAPLRVHLYRDVSGYRAADRRLTGGRFLRNEAMSHWDTKSAHVALQPPCPDALLAARGLPLQTEVMLAWEATHIARYTLCANFQLHPGWFHDGLAGAVARRTLQRRLPQAKELPFFTQRWLRAKELLRVGRLPSARQLLTDETQDLSMRDRYAVRVAFFGFAAARAPTALRRLAQRIAATEAGPAYAGAILEQAVASLAGLDDAFRAAVAAVAPAWNEEVRSLWCVGDEWRQRAFPQADAIALRCEPTRGSRFGVTASVAVLDAGSACARLLFGLEGRRGFALSLAPARGYELLALGPQGEALEVLARGACDELRVGAACPLELWVDGRDLELQVGAARRRVRLPRALPRDVRWGIAAESAGVDERYGSAVVWRGVRAGGT